MALKKTNRPKKQKQPRKPISLSLSKKQKVLLGSFIALLGIAFLFSFTSFLFTWQADQSIVGIVDRDLKTENWLSTFGSNIAYVFIYQGFGIAGYIFAGLMTLTGVYLFFDLTLKRLRKFWFWGILLMIWLSVFFGFFSGNSSILSGVIGFELNDLMQDYMGFIGTVLSMTFFAIVYLVVRLGITPDKIINGLRKTKKDIADDFNQSPTTLDTNQANTPTDVDTDSNLSDQTEIPLQTTATQNTEAIQESVEISSEAAIKNTQQSPTKEAKEQELSMEIRQAKEEEVVVENLSDKLVKDFGEFDPTLELSNYKFPTIELLKDYTSGQGITINQEELEENKNRIVETLNNYKIGIASIKATVGPTVTLYEIVPEAGIRISKIKNLEDDIALSLSALGIRIIAPIPGRGTIGIEVPNKNPKTVSMRTTIASPKFQNAEMELPLALGKTISNETFVVDLAKMPHLLMAGATGQGKSVGLNAILTSLLYKKHPAEVKFVLVDPKKVELTLFNKIERHYLAKLPGDEDAIITDTNKVITTLNSLCVEMDKRYDLLKNAYVRNIKEYNTKFKERKLNPEEDHRYLPYIVLVIDEFADLIMTAGKEVETPIARLAQLARAIGIHLIVATQRPSVNVITGIIKANFPARIAFRVTSKIDSRTILDSGGADQLIGRGDMLYTQGNDLVRIQCAFVDTPEIADITDYIGGQKAYPDAYILPEYISEEGGTNLDNNINERDVMFREAAEVLVIAQQGSASLLQRKLKLGYNRAGRIIDQLEAAGIVGPFEGSKARSVSVPTLEALNQLLENE